LWRSQTTTLWHIDAGSGGRPPHQVYLSAGIAYTLNRALRVPHNVACPSALIGASNFFELAVAAAIALFGFQSGAALATVVGVLLEVPVMLSVARIVLRTRSWYERQAAS
jgi:ACR3 family arsenite transporter